ncbi:sterile alpha motif domain-containing 3-like isoform X2 [Labeo rohita]|uniref:Sterile alpha motif domain-containing 3-like isoform X2 n=1 Tax=Labeo rohita TaxID=84645 RepID=A0A498P176_LABRO|nr:sterile alpha motif domain-containing 3-like isoform X2 [Labeo rohita]
MRTSTLCLVFGLVLLMTWASKDGRPCEKMQWKYLDLGILLVEREGAVSPSSLHLNPASFKIVIEGEVVMKSIKDLPKAMCLLFGLTYALHLSYPKPMKNTFQFIQQRQCDRTGNRSIT